MFAPRQQNALRGIIRRYGLSEDKFDFFVEARELRIVYKAQGFHFRIVALRLPASQPNLYIYSTPQRSGSVLEPDKEAYHSVDAWDDAEVSLEEWVDWLIEEYEVPNNEFVRLSSKISKHLDKITSVVISNKTSQPAPSLTHLHPTIQAAAGSLFASSHYPQAILAACTALDKAVQAKAKLPASTVGTSLMTTAFSAKSPLIQLSQDANEQMGFMNLYQGSVQAIRNHYAHNLTEIPAPRALEWLSFISALFYKLDEV